MAGKSGISVSLPLTYDLVDGPFYLNKNLVLTNPGERIMDPSFGVGLRTFLFEQINDETYTKIATKIRQQLVAYLPFINVNGIYFDDASTNSDLGYNEIHLGISYNIAPLDINDTLSITTLLN